MRLSPDVASAVVLAANRTGLEAALVGAIVAQESGGVSWAVRFEPGWKYFATTDGLPCDRAAVRGLAPCTDETERIFQSTSLGLMQVMGSVARAQGFRGPFLARLCDDAGLGLEYGCRLLATLRARHEVEPAISAYNAGEGGIGTNREYVRSVMAFYGSFKAGL